jgi:hypothetical protein
VPLHDGHGPFPNLPLPRHNSHNSVVVCSGAGFTGTSLLGVGGLYRLDCVGRRLRMCVKTLSVFPQILFARHGLGGRRLKSCHRWLISRR